MPITEDNPKRYWKSLEERNASPGAADEFAEPIEGVTGEFSRRGFLRATGFTAAATLAGCSRIPVQKAIPYLVKPEEITPGRSYFYASTCGACSAGCGVLAKCRDGRPVKLEGNPGHPLSRGGLCAVGQASLLGLYDSQRLTGPLADGKKTSWEEVDRAVTARLDEIRRRGGEVRILTGAITSPTLRAAIQEFLARFPGARRVTYDAPSSSAILDAHERTHGIRALPRYRFDRAGVMAGFDADFLGAWLSPVEHAAGWRAGRQPEADPPRFSYHVQFESLLTLTGAKADRRYRIAPQEIPFALTHLAARVAKLAGAVFDVPALEDPPVPAAALDDLAGRLWQARGRSLVVCGAQDRDAQALCNLLNHLLGNYGSTLDLDQPSLVREGDDAELEKLWRESRERKVAALLLLGVNPVYELPGGAELARLLEATPLVVSFAERLDETAKLAHYVCPDHHFLESWGDAEAADGIVSLFQPAIHPVAQTRSVLETLAAWSGVPKSAYDIVRTHWEATIFHRQQREPSFPQFWDRAVEQGFAEVEPQRGHPKPFTAAAVHPVTRAARSSAETFTLLLYPKPQMLGGRHAGNPWLHELPDPITKVTWDNYASLSPAAAARVGVGEGDVVRLTVEDGGRTQSLELPAFLQPGQHDGVVGVALGYGSELSRRFAQVGPQWLWGRPSVGPQGLVGVNAAPFLTFSDGLLAGARTGVKLVRTGEKRALASTQTHNTLSAPEVPGPAAAETRPIIHEILFPILGQTRPPAPGGEEQQDLWPPDHPESGHRWGMAIDLDACTGCSACVVACQAENNIPVVGKDEVLRRREMHWIRLDRYYSGERGEVDVAFQPMLCQQCDNAPCETVCPVLATVHSAEGLNEQIYNRCVGTRYCANNCPYKVRRFNWFDYPHNDRLANLALNPDVAVRSRGVMEKCTFCVQRIQEAKIEAKLRGEPLADGAIQPACQQSCPAQAIVFGDLNDSQSRVARLRRSRRHYRVLEELNFKPAVGYLAVVRNRAPAEEDHHG
ncbi:MAG TPA: TAT-variant-translocated molybdopterin oxidoreductase [Bryobacterales bacterium]|nr:TAT-variant-translocated molybdopterin oxidoreductase [Bryobacterales bacterium]